MSQATNRFIRGTAENARSAPWKSVHPPPLDHRKRSLPADIAMQRMSQKSLKQNRTKKNFFQNCFGLMEPRIARFSPAADVLPFLGLLTSPDQVRLSNVQNNNRRSRRDHIKAA